ncbi:MAG: iron chelate uptake ABC transporter family permease subunit [Hyphomicrobiales bacterium]
MHTSFSLNGNSNPVFIKLIIALLGVIILFILNISFGNVFIDPFEALRSAIGLRVDNDSLHVIVNEYRMPQAITAFIAGSGLSIAGLIIQTLFKNPLSGPSVLGISSGASLGVAIVLLFFGSLDVFNPFTNISSSLLIVLAALIGSGIILFVILFFSKFLKSNISLLIIGLMFGYLTSSVVGILNLFSSANNVKSFVVWGLGSFSGVNWDSLPFFSIVWLLGVFLSFLVIKPLNSFLLGERYAINLGVSISRNRFYFIFISSFLTAIITAYCGPIAFIGLAVPHLARSLFRTYDHQILIPAVILIGGFIALFCNLISRLPGSDYVLPINSITSFVGAPIVIWFIIRRGSKL